MTHADPNFNANIIPPINSAIINPDKISYSKYYNNKDESNYDRSHNNLRGNLNNRYFNRGRGNSNYKNSNYKINNNYNRSNGIPDNHTKDQCNPRIYPRGRGGKRGRGRNGKPIYSRYNLRSVSSSPLKPASVHYPEEAPATPEHNPSFEEDLENVNYTFGNNSTSLPPKAVEYGSMSSIVLPNTLISMKNVSNLTFDTNGDFSPQTKASTPPILPPVLTINNPLIEDLDSIKLTTPCNDSKILYKLSVQQLKIEQLKQENEHLKVLLKNNGINF